MNTFDHYDTQMAMHGLIEVYRSSVLERLAATCLVTGTLVFVVYGTIGASLSTVTTAAIPTAFVVFMSSCRIRIHPRSHEVETRFSLGGFHWARKRSIHASAPLSIELQRTSNGHRSGLPGGWRLGIRLANDELILIPGTKPNRRDHYAEYKTLKHLLKKHGTQSPGS